MKINGKVVGAEVVTFSDGNKRARLFIGLDKQLNGFGCEYVSVWTATDREYHFGDIVPVDFSRKFKKWYMAK